MNRKILAVTIALIISFTSYAQSDSAKITFTRLTNNVYVFTSNIMLSSGPFPCNGLYIPTKEGIVLIDMPSYNWLTKQLIDSLTKKYHQKIILSISTHFHSDRTGGITALKQAGVKTYSSLQTLQACIKSGDQQARYYFTKDTVFTLGGVTLQTYYPGPGHTSDNIVVWLPQQKILFGGCFVKSTDTDDIGNVADANVAAWPASIKKVMAAYKDARFVIPGHQGWSNINSLQHTLDILAKQHQ